jgi:hypothetical protein
VFWNGLITPRQVTPQCPQIRKIDLETKCTKSKESFDTDKWKIVPAQSLGAGEYISALSLIQHEKHVWLGGFLLETNTHGRPNFLYKLRCPFGHFSRKLSPLAPGLSRVSLVR